MNAYTTEFFAACPNNSVRIKYRLRIETTEVLSVEELTEAVQATDEGYHEEIADQMLARFGGTQMMVADHHGVTIETLRANREPSNVADKRGAVGDSA
jgi:hypothetical protein